MKEFFFYLKCYASFVSAAHIMLLVLIVPNSSTFDSEGHVAVCFSSEECEDLASLPRLRNVMFLNIFLTRIISYSWPLIAYHLEKKKLAAAFKAFSASL